MFAGFDLDDERQFGFKGDEEEFDRLTGSSSGPGR
jgi:hypothetical protein